MVDVENVVNKAGGISALCEKLGIKNKMTVRQWIKRNSIPTRWVIAIERVTDFQCFELRPDIYPPERFDKAS